MPLSLHINNAVLIALARRARAIAAALLCGIPLTACELFEEPGDVVIVNNSSHQIIVTAGEETQVAFQGRAVEVPYPNPGAFSGGHIRIETTLCRMDFQVPLDSDDYPWRTRANGELALQLETDFKLYAVAPAVRLPVQLTTVTRLQHGEFPISPTEMRCGRSDEDR